jgi:hypothetical protein
MYEIPEEYNRILERCHKLKPGHFGCHGVGRKDKSKIYSTADIKTMFEVHEEFTTVLGEKPLNNRSLRRMRRWRFNAGNVKDLGFQRTVTFKKYGNPSTWESQWYTMPVSDCGG